MRIGGRSFGHVLFVKADTDTKVRCYTASVEETMNEAAPLDAHDTTALTHRFVTMEVLSPDFRYLYVFCDLSESP